MRDVEWLEIVRPRQPGMQFRRQLMFERRTEEGVKKQLRLAGCEKNFSLTVGDHQRLFKGRFQLLFGVQPKFDFLRQFLVLLRQVSVHGFELRLQFPDMKMGSYAS